MRPRLLVYLLFSVGLVGVGALVRGERGEGPFAGAPVSAVGHDHAGRTHRDASISWRERPVPWFVWRRAARSVKITAFVPYCEAIGVKPRISRVVKHENRAHRDIVLDMYVQFPFRKGSHSYRGCGGFALGVSQWIRLGTSPREVALLDGSTSPPTVRSEPRE